MWCYKGGESRSDEGVSQTEVFYWRARGLSGSNACDDRRKMLQLKCPWIFEAKTCSRREGSSRQWIRARFTVILIIPLQEISLWREQRRQCTELASSCTESEVTCVEFSFLVQANIIEPNSYKSRSLSTGIKYTETSFWWPRGYIYIYIYVCLVRRQILIEQQIPKRRYNWNRLHGDTDTKKHKHS